VGYWEVMAGESSVGVTIHYATAQVNAGDVLATATIPIEECDTLASLRIKADLVGAQLYHEAIRKVARGEGGGAPQDQRRGHTFRTPAEIRVWRLERELKKRARRRMPLLKAQPGALARARVGLQYVLLLPWLLAIRRRLRRQRRSPVCVLYYHLVANRPLNHMCLPLEEFVRQMEFLRRYHRLVPLQEVAGRLRECGGDELAVAITFDDGYRDNCWAVDYMHYLGLPGAFFVSIGHVLDGSPFEHDVRRGFTEALPMQPADVQKMAAEGFLIGSHGLHHEELGALDPAGTERVLAESRRLIAEMVGAPPEFFAFPRGHRGTNITAATFAAASRHYPYVYSADAGYNFPGPQLGGLFRVGGPTNVQELAAALDGYTGFRECLRGNAWGLKTTALAFPSPESSRVDPRRGSIPSGVPPVGRPS
jgi:peptidoglycan/xylan/chitin deacetylase (PgdA/CDA1 family)